MSREQSFEEEYAGNPGSFRHSGRLIVIGIAMFALASFYGVIAVITQLDAFFLPGNEIKPGVLSRLPGVDSGENPDVANLKQRINILVMGLDRRLDEPKDMATRTDTIFIMTVDPFGKTGGVLSIPRDLLVEIPNGRGGYFEDRINVAYELGELGYVSFPGGGPGLAKATIERNFGIPIDNYLVLDFANFIEIIDEIGGIDIEVPEYLYDPEYQDCNRCALEPIEFEPGLQHMDGKRALAYARIRYGSNDLERIERQQQLMRATADKAARINFISPAKALSLYKKYKDAVKTDLSDFRLPGLSRLASQIPADQINMLSLRDAVYDCLYCPAAVLLADWGRVEQIKQQLFLDGYVRSEAALVEIQNGTDIPGVAALVAEKLALNGFPADQILLADNSASNIIETKIYNIGAKNYTAQKLAEWLGIPATQIVSGSAELLGAVNGHADIIILAGTDVTLSSS
ncbi:MAG TPA: LCP family protein [Dehalococcoidia bacterium]|nr:LCP family protein [Dehalococcoidia bacterium]